MFLVCAYWDLLHYMCLYLCKSLTLIMFASLSVYLDYLFRDHGWFQPLWRPAWCPEVYPHWNHCSHHHHLHCLYPLITAPCRKTRLVGKRNFEWCGFFFLKVLSERSGLYILDINNSRIVYVTQILIITSLAPSVPARNPLKWYFKLSDDMTDTSGPIFDRTWSNDALWCFALL